MATKASKKAVSEKRKKLVLLDAHAILHRAFHAVPGLMSSAGVPTGALFGVCNMILKMNADLKPDYVVACYDLPQPTFRHQSYDGYKKGRKQTDDTLKVQIDESRKIFEALSIPIYEVPGFEADDMLGTIVEQILVGYPDVDVVICSGDMDTLQLVTDDRVVVYTLKKGITDTVVYNENAVNERYGFGPNLIPDYKGLRGDPSDNIIGVPGIGEKTATDLITKFGTIEEIYKQLHADSEVFIKQGIKERIVKLLIEQEESALFSKILATIRRDAPITFEIPEHTFQSGYKPDAVVKLLREYEIRSLVSKFESLFVPKQPKSEFVPSEHPDDFDVVKTSPQPSSAKAFDNTADGSLFFDKSSYETAIRASVGLWVLNSDMLHPSQEEVLRETETNTLDEALAVIKKKLAQKNLLEVFEGIEEPLIPVVQKMSDHGIILDRAFLANLSKDYHQKLDVLSAEIFTLAGKEFNINSPKQLAEVLFSDLGLKSKGKRGKAGSFSTKSEVLNELADDNEIVRKILEYRELQKLLSTYIDAFPEFLDSHDRLHAQFLQHGSATGRFSSQNPNMQNLPIKSESGRAIRNAFRAADGYKLVSADYSQIELRMLAILSNDSLLKEVFTTGRDIHAAVAAQMFKIPESDVTKNQRRDAKVINFGILYGMGITALAKNLETNRADAEIFYEAYFAAFPTIKAYLESVKATAKETLETRTIFGRVRNFPMYRSKLPYMQALADRAAVNAPIQGSNADIIKLAMIDIDAMVNESGWGDQIFPVMQIHDELVYEVPDSLVAEFAKKLRATMENVMIKHKDLALPEYRDRLDLPITVSVEAGQTLGNMDKIV